MSRIGAVIRSGSNDFVAGRNSRRRLRLCRKPTMHFTGKADSEFLDSLSVVRRPQLG